MTQKKVPPMFADMNGIKAERHRRRVLCNAGYHLAGICGRHARAGGAHV